MNARRLAQPDQDRIAGFRITPKSRKYVELDLYGQDGRRVGRPTKLTTRDAARVWCAAQELALDDDAWLALPSVWRDASALRGGEAVADAFERLARGGLAK